MPRDTKKTLNKSAANTTKKVKAAVSVKREKEDTKEEYRLRIMTHICSLVSQKQVLTQICQLPDMPCYDTVYQWMNESPELSDMYARARSMRAFARGDKIDHITQQVANGELDPQAARVIIDAEKWQMGKERPKDFGDKLELTHEAGESLAEAMKQARERAGV